MHHTWQIYRRLHSPCHSFAAIIAPFLPAAVAPSLLVVGAPYFVFLELFRPPLSKSSAFRACCLTLFSSAVTTSLSSGSGDFPSSSASEIMKKQRKMKKIENRGSLSQVTKSPSSSKATSRSRLDHVSDMAHHVSDMAQT
ncbi:hypothetical protein PIB30_056259 [Stylosanthes scabra]|uniref:Uncharacterized protein n=1 Tax=Stylosanthes scabra TaxID=79078 RepID=A0ABU6ZHZ7_9FABA|nr:hypothetical protein [Stylosanthes scabra]